MTQQHIVFMQQTIFQQVSAPTSAILNVTMATLTDEAAVHTSQRLPHVHVTLTQSAY